MLVTQRSALPVLKSGTMLVSIRLVLRAALIVTRSAVCPRR